MHCSISGCGDVLAKSEEEAISYARKYISYFPDNFKNKPDVEEPKLPSSFEKSIEEIIPKNQNASFNMHDLIDRIIDEDSFCEVKNCLLVKSSLVLHESTVSLSASLQISHELKVGYCSMIRQIRLRNL